MPQAYIRIMAEDREEVKRIERIIERALKKKYKVKTNNRLYKNRKGKGWRLYLTLEKQETDNT